MRTDPERGRFHGYMPRDKMPSSRYQVVGFRERLSDLRAIGACIAALALALAVAGSARGASGNWERAWGKDVISGNAETGFEVCTAAASCQSAISGGLGGELNFPYGVATDATGAVYVTDEFNHRIQKFDAAGNWERAWGKDVVTGGATGFEICTVTADCKAGDSTGGLGGELDFPEGIATDAAGAVYVADLSNHRIQKFDSSGNFLRAWGKDVISGNAETGFEICVAASGDTCQAGTSGGLGGELNGPSGVATDAGSLYVVDRSNFRIQKFNLAGSFQRTWGKDVDSGGGTDFEICTVAADCQAGTAGDLGGEFSFPDGIATDAAGALYVADNFNNRIQKFDSSGNFLRAWGKNVDSGGGTGFEICAVAANCKIGASGGFGGELIRPTGVATDAAGAVYVGDTNNHRIQRFDSAGHWERVWGKDVVTGGSTDFETCTAAPSCKSGMSGGLGGELNAPYGVATNAAGELYAADEANHRIQKFADPPPPPTPPEGGDEAGDTDPPDTTITQKPKDKTKKKTATFEFTSSEPASTFECKLDSGPFQPCASPVTLKVKRGKHSFRVRATDQAGNVDGSPATDSWKVQRKRK
jgi:hypothetical protein